jgi:hypothetical protein
MSSDVQPPERILASALEPVIGQVYFAPECHEGYQRLGFDGSSGKTGDTQLPDGPAYFTSRGSVLGQVSGRVVAAAFGVFNPAVVEACVAIGWSRTDAPTIAAVRQAGATAQLARILGEAPAGLTPVVDNLRRAVDALAPAGRALFSGVTSQPDPDTDLGWFFRLGDALREYRGDSHLAAWTAAGFDAVEMGLMSERWWGLPFKSYVRTRAWSTEQLDAGLDRLTARGYVSGDGLTDAGHDVRERIERATDVQCRVAVDAIGDAFDATITTLLPWGVAVRAAGGYLASGPHDLAAQAGQRANGG